MTELTKEQRCILRAINREPLQSDPHHSRFWTQLVDSCRNDARGNHPTDAESLYAAGAENLKQVRKFWQAAFNALGVQRANWHEYLTNFQLTAEEIIAAGTKAQDCNIVSHWRTSVVDGLIPQCPIEAVPLQERSTTFHSCGWCNHAIARTTEFHTNAATKGYCQLLGPDLMQFTSCRETCYLTQTTNFNPRLIQKRIQHIKELLKQKLRKTEQLQKEIRLRLDVLDEAIKQAPKDRPLYSNWRDLSWLNTPTTAIQAPAQDSGASREQWRGSEVVCFLKLSSGSYITAHGFIQDATINGEDPNQYVVHARCELRPGYYPESAFPFKLRDYTIFTRSEFDYFFQHQGDFREWFRENRNSRDQPSPDEIDNLAQALFYSGNV